TAFAYDAHGNTTTLGDQTHRYDAADRHRATQTSTATITYLRDATDRIVARSTGAATPGPLTRTLVDRGTASNGSVVINGASSTAGELFVVTASVAGGGTPDLSVTDSAGLTWTEQAAASASSYHQVATSIFTATATGTSTNITIS